MTTLQEKLDATKKQFLAKVPGEVLGIMERAEAALEASGILDGVPKAGDLLPAFDLEAGDGRRFRSEELLERGPLVLSFYRGVW